MNLRSTIGFAAALVALTLAGAAQAGPGEKARDALDPDCTVGKAARGAAQRATIGVGNRCKAGETARDVLGVDDNDRKKNRDGDGPLGRRNKD